MSGACIEKISLAGGKFEICRFANSPRIWYYRQYVNDGGKRTYIKRSLKTDDQGVAEEEAWTYWSKLKSIQTDGGSITSKSIQVLMDDWIEQNRKRVETGEIQESTWRSKKSFFTNSLVNYFKSRVKRITDLQSDTFNDFRYWRTLEGWKFYKGSNPNQRKPPTDGTINSEIGLINEWFNNYLIPKGYVVKKPVIKLKTLEYDDLSANPPIPVKQWEMIWRYLKSWSESKVGVNRLKSFTGVNASGITCFALITWATDPLNSLVALIRRRGFLSVVFSGRILRLFLKPVGRRVRRRR